MAYAGMPARTVMRGEHHRACDADMLHAVIDKSFFP